MAAKKRKRAQKASRRNDVHRATPLALAQVVTTVRVPKAMYERALRRAVGRGLTFTGYLNALLYEDGK